MEITPTHISCTLSLPNPVSALEVRVFNHSDEEITLDSLSFTLIE